MYFQYNIYKSSKTDLSEAVQELLSGIPDGKIPVRLVFFGNSYDNVGYLKKRDMVLSSVSKYYGQDRPLVTFVAQEPIDATLYLECHLVDKPQQDRLSFRNLSGVEYALVNIDGNKLLLTEGILPSSLDIPMKDQALEVFDKLEKILSYEGLPISSIDRQWNYIEDIVGEKYPGLQNYQQLNDARSLFYSKTDWKNGYPAATGIGTQSGGIMVEVDAASMENLVRIPIDNALQVAAHAYSNDVLVGKDESKTTPKFERAKAVIRNNDNGTSDVMVYVSGTAAIRGEESLFGVGIEKQTIITLENIEYLISKKTINHNNIVLDKDLFVTTFRVYLKNRTEFEKARDIISSRYPRTPVLFVLSDVCRPELLIEIEGTVGINN